MSPMIDFLEYISSLKKLLKTVITIGFVVFLYEILLGISSLHCALRVDVVLYEFMYIFLIFVKDIVECNKGIPLKFLSIV